VGARQKGWLSDGQADAVVDRIERPAPAERIAQLIQARRSFRDAAQLRNTPRDVERARAAEEIVCRPSALQPETLHAAVAPAEPHLVTWSLEDLNHDLHGVAGDRTLRRDGIDERHIDRAEDAHAIEIALCLIEIILPEGVAAPHRDDAPHGRGIYVAQPANDHSADSHPHAGLRVQLDLRTQNPRLRIEVAQHLGVGVAVVTQPPDDRVRRSLHEEAVEGIADLQRQIAFQLRDVENPFETRHVEPRHPDRLTLVDAEHHVHVARRAPHDVSTTAFM
jgi:hypothetical protein